ncbi:unnamed protein product [Polarella glacialis]|uniref:Methyltransferase domain-containing protein n=2 Tax=Polarella glacialis TaxID=89957 RepID=A0A813HNE8_POLGL|nr:unnamed protein product [Polarella glacialis]
MEVLSEEWINQETGGRCPKKRCQEPAAHAAEGFPVIQFAVSFVHPDLLVGGASFPSTLPSPALSPASETPTVSAAAKAVPSWPSLAKCKVEFNDRSSRPGKPCLTKAKPWPYTTNTQWKTELGERVVAAATGVVTKAQCKGWYMFGDMTWCLNAVKRRKGGSELIGLSYGIEQRDLWSEKMSNMYKVPTRLYDCFQQPKDSDPLGGKAPNATGKCDPSRPACYETPYQAFQICSGPDTGIVEGRKYESLQKHLKDRERLSVHLKIDTEGSEWEVLEWLLSSPEDMDKIRTFDMEVHMGWAAASSRKSPRSKVSAQDRLEFDLDILERLGQHFRCTGSSIEVLASAWVKAEDGGRCPKQQCGEPDVHAAGGFPVTQFAISFVHPDLLIGGGPAPSPPVPRLLSPASEAGKNNNNNNITTQARHKLLNM